MNEIIFEFPEVPQINFLIDLQGESLYQKWLELELGTGTHEDFLNWLKVKGDNGFNAYELAVQLGYEGTLEEWIASLKQPALDAAQTANVAAEAADIAAGNANEAAGVALAAAEQLEVDLSGKVDKQEGYSLMLDTEIQRLASVYNVDITGKVDKVTGYSLVADTDIAKIHARNTDSTLLSENGEHSIYVDNAGIFHVKGISQSGASYETHAEQVFTTKNEIILRDGAIAGLGVGEYVGLRAKRYDGVNDGLLVFDKDGWARVGDVGALQKLATIEETPTDGNLLKYNTLTNRIESINIFGNLNTWDLKQTFTSGINSSSYKDLLGNNPFVSQNGGTSYHIVKWFTTTQTITIAADGLSASVPAAQFTAGASQVGAKLTVNGYERIITTPNPTTTVVYVTEAFPIEMRGQSYASGLWGVYRIRFDGATIFSSNPTSYAVIVPDGSSVFYNGSSFNSSETNKIDNIGLRLKSTGKIYFGSTDNFGATIDLGIRRNAAGLLEIYDGVTNGALRDLILRNLTVEKLKPLTDSTTAIQIMKADGTTSVVTVDTVNRRIGVNTTNPQFDFDLGGFGTPAAVGVNPNYIMGIAKGVDGSSGIQMHNPNNHSSSDFRFTLLNNDKTKTLSVVCASENNGNLTFGIPRNTCDFIWNFAISGTPRHLAIGTFSNADLIFGANNAEVARFKANGNLLIGTTTDNGTDKLQVNGSISAIKIKMTDEGGYCVKMTNKTGAASVKGTVVSASDTTDNAFKVNQIDGDMPIGIVYENGVADGSECWVVVAGIAEVLLVNNVSSTRSYIAYSSATVAGRIDTAASAPAANLHFRENGHTLESKTAGTNVLCKCSVHFN
jgi:hypothetical protein